MSKFTHYETFVACVEEGSLALAAVSRNLSPSSVSKQISSLEDQLHTVLLERSNRSLNLTESGQAFYLHCKSILEKVKEGEENIFAARDRIEGRINLTIASSLFGSPVMEAISAFSYQYPDVRFKVNSTDIIENLINQRFDFAIRIGNLKDSQLRASPLFAVQPMFCASPRYIERFGLPTKLADLTKHRLAFTESSNLASILDRILGTYKRSINLDNLHETKNMTSLLEMTKSGLCIGTLLDASIRKELKNGELIKLLPKHSIATKKVYLVYAKQGFLPKKFKLFKDFFQKYF